MRKLNLFHHILTLEEDDIAKKGAETQIVYGFPGLIKECEMLLQKYKLDNLDVNDYNKFTWKIAVKKAVMKEAK